LNKGLNSPSKVPGPLKDLREKILLWMSERRKTETDLAGKQEREQSFQTLQTELEREESRLRDLEHVITANRKIQETQKRRETLIQQDQRFERIKQQYERLQTELETLNQRLTQEPVAMINASEYEAIRALTVREAQQKQGGDPQNQTNPSLMGFWITGAVLVVISGALLAWKQWMLGLGVLVMASVVWGLGWKRFQQQHEQTRKNEIERQAQQTQIATLREERQTWENRVGVRLEDILKRWPEAQQGVTQKSALERQVREHESVDEAQWSVVRRELRLLQDTLEDPALLPLLLEPLEMARKERDYQTLKVQVEEKRRQRDKLQALLEHDPINPDRLAEWDEMLTEGKDRLAYLEQQARIGQAALDGLERARKATLHPARQVLETQAGAILSTISAGRYTQMSVNDEDLACQILVPETQRWDDPNVLSHGTFDQFYLSLRLALGDILAGGKKPPLLLDDPFMTFDPERQSRFLEWLQHRSKEQQIMFFTCRTDYHRFADNVIEIQSLTTAGPKGV
jgi:DNA repair exonuclease SbcCD ATPase subunit